MPAWTACWIPLLGPLIKLSLPGDLRGLSYLQLCRAWGAPWKSPSREDFLLQLSASTSKRHFVHVCLSCRAGLSSAHLALPGDKECEWVQTLLHLHLPGHLGSRACPRKAIRNLVKTLAECFLHLQVSFSWPLHRWARISVYSLPRGTCLSFTSSSLHSLTGSRNLCSVVYLE